MLSLSRIVGHGRLTALLAAAVARGTLPPTMLFVGRAGVGKCLTARAVAAALNCLAPRTDAPGLPVDACGKCRACDRVSRDMHVDVLTLEPDERASIKIDVVRETLVRTGFRPFEGRRRIVIIRDADTLEPAAQNALLKSLEEPPPATSFILTTAVPGILLPTVRSRCIPLRFGRLTDQEIARVLQQDHGFSDDEARSAATLAGGSVRQALDLSTSEIADLRALAIRLLRQAAATRSPKARFDVATEIAGGTGSGKDGRPREEVGTILRLAASMVRDLEALNAGGDESLVVNTVMSDQLRSLQTAYGGRRARDAFSDLMQAIVALDRPAYAGTKVVADWIAARV